MAENLLDKMMSDKTDLDTLAAQLPQIEQYDEQKLLELADLQKQMKEFLVQRFQDNIEAFEKFMPDVAKTFKNYKPKEEMEFFCTDNGIPNLLFTKRNDFFYKTFDPFELCKKQIEAILENNHLNQTRYEKEGDPYGQIHFKYLRQIVQTESELARDRSATIAQLGSIPHCVMLGVGLGYQLAYLYERVEIANLILVEPDLDIFYASLHAFDWASLLKFLTDNHYGIHLMIGQDKNQFYLDMERFYNHHGRFLSGTWLGMIHYHSDKIHEIAKFFIQDFSNVHASMGFFDDHLFGCSHAVRAILDKKAFIKTKPQFPKSLANTPVFIIGSGPSLDQDIPFLRKYQDKAIIIACGTALDTLYHTGIKPDFYACTERTPQIGDVLNEIPDKHFFDDIILLCGDVVHPKTTKFFKHSAIFLKLDEPFAKFASYFIDELKGIRGVQLMNPLVGNMGVSGALSLGFENLYLFGLDNGSALEYNDMHSAYTAIYKANKVNTKSIAYATDKVAEGNFGGICKTGYLFEISARNIGFILERFIVEGSKIKCHNCSNGVKLKHTTPVHSCDLVGKFDKKKDLDKKAFHDYMVKEKTTVIENLTLDRLKQLFDPSLFNQIVDSIVKYIDEKDPDNRTEIILFLESISEYIASLKQVANTYFIGDCLEGSLQTYFMMASRSLYNSIDEKLGVECYKKIMQIIKDFLVESKSLFVHLPDYVIWDHKKYHPNNKVGVDTPTTKAPDFPGYRHFKKSSDDDPQKIFEKRYE